jgi:hypothetical protein
MLEEKSAGIKNKDPNDETGRQRDNRGMQSRVRRLLHRAFDIFPDSGNARRQSGWRALRAIDERSPLQTVRQARTPFRLRGLATVGGYVRRKLT